MVCPGSLVKNWAVEFNKWLGRERISVYTVDQVCLDVCFCSLTQKYLYLYWTVGYSNSKASEYTSYVCVHVYSIG